MNRNQVIRLILAALGVLVGAGIGAALGRLGTGIEYGVGLGILMALPTVSFSEPTSEFYVLRLLGPKVATAYLIVVAPAIYIFFLVFGLGSAYAVYKIDRLALAAFVLAVTLLAVSLWTRVVMQLVALLRGARTA
ncbi:MAG TPA: hypothetical protein VGS99_05305 [Gammaproteobacteria bacterium]|nr:hypothetical protein [Gammaproteobacteria bacterium]